MAKSTRTTPKTDPKTEPNNLEPLEVGSDAITPTAGSGGAEARQEEDAKGKEAKGKDAENPAVRDGLDTLRNRIAGGRRLIEHLRHTGTGAAAAVSCADATPGNARTLAKSAPTSRFIAIAVPPMCQTMPNLWLE